MTQFVYPMVGVANSRDIPHLSYLKGDCIVVVMVMVQTCYNIVPFFGCEKIRKGRKIDPSYYSQELRFPIVLSYNHEQKAM